MSIQTQQVQQLYIALFGRPADPAGLASWANILTTDPNAIPTIVATLASTPEYAAAFGGKTSAEIVTAIYRNMFNLAPDSADVARLAGQLDQGTNLGTVLTGIRAAGSEVTLNAKVAAAEAFTAALDTQAEVNAFATSTGRATAREYIAYVDTESAAQAVTTPFAISTVTREITQGVQWSLPDTVTDQVQRLYVAYFSRAADPFGFDYWASLLDGDPANPRLGFIASGFAQSAEYQQEYSQATNAQKVAAVYQNLFSRAGEQAGIDFWAGQLDSGAVTVENMVLALAAGAQGSDAVAFNAKVDVAEAITEAINTGPEIVAYSGTAANDIVSAYIARVRDAETLRTAIEPAAIDALIASLPTPPATPGTGVTDNIELVGIAAHAPGMPFF